MKLKYPPIKYPTNKTPKKLIYYRFFHNKIHDFSISTTTKPFITGVLTCSEEQEFRNNGERTAIFVGLIKSNPRKNGLGTEMLNMAINLSKKLGHEGRIFLCAFPSLCKEEVPHIFYRKFGMNCEDKKLNKKMDKFIKEGKIVTIKDFPDKTYMYYPPVPTVKPEKIRKKSLIDNFLDVFKLIKNFNKN